MEYSLLINDNEKTKLTEASLRAIESLIRSAELTRKSKYKSKYTNYLDSYFKKAKNHIL